MSLLPTGKTILSLFDFSGNWAKPYEEAGYNVVRVDIKHGRDVRLVEYSEGGGRVYGIIAAPPCTDFSGSGAQYWPEKDRDGRTLQSLALVDAAMRIILAHRDTLAFWALENPVGRLRRWIGPPAYCFNPCDFGDPYTKKTLLWGNFNKPKKNPVAPIKSCSQGSWLMKLGGKSEKTKELRSITPIGFARAFYEVNQ